MYSLSQIWLAQKQRNACCLQVQTAEHDAQTARVFEEHFSPSIILY